MGTRIGSLVLAGLVAGLAVRDASAESKHLCGDVNQSEALTASDALTVLKSAVGQNVTLLCGAPAGVLRTGQTSCFNSLGTTIPCATTGQDADFRKGLVRSFTDNGDGTVTDNVTRLMWEVLSDDGTIHDQDSVNNWAGAFTKMSTLNFLKFAGYNDWRLPNEFELYTLFDYDHAFPAAIVPAFRHDCAPGCAAPACSCTPTQGNFWSSTSSVFDTSRSWMVGTNSGVGFESLKTGLSGVRAVRDGYPTVQDQLVAMSADSGSAAGGDVPSCGDVNNSASITASDALSILKAAVGQDVTLNCPASGGPLKTGQTTCVDAGGDAIACAGTKEDGDLQRGFPRSYTDNGNGTVTDNSTGLMWEKLSADGSVHDRGTQYTWSGAVGTKTAALNLANFAGHNDWRLPNVLELISILDLGLDHPAVGAVFNHLCEAGCSVTQCSCSVLSGNSWTSTSYVNAEEEAWYVDFVFGKSNVHAKTMLHNARAVRGGS